METMRAHSASAGLFRDGSVGIVLCFVSRCAEPASLVVGLSDVFRMGGFLFWLAVDLAVQCVCFWIITYVQIFMGCLAALSFPDDFAETLGLSVGHFIGALGAFSSLLMVHIEHCG